MAPSEQSAARSTALSRLAAHYGIEPGFRDARGEDVVTTAQTQMRLLAAMGVKADTDQHALAGLEQTRSAVAQAALPPVFVVHSADGDCSVELTLPGDLRRLSWSVKLEQGSELGGVVDPILRSDMGPDERICLKLGELPWGYHRLHLTELKTSVALIITPGKCWLPKSLREEAGLWGVAAQLYLLRSDQNWGIGDFTDLSTLVSLSQKRGSDVIGLNPLHQMILDRPEQASPYSPLSRLYLNVLYIAVPQAPGCSTSAVVRRHIESSEFQARLKACREAPLVDYSDVLALKLEVLRMLHAEFTQGMPEHRRSFQRFCSEKGVSLRRTSIFQLLRRHFGAQDSDLSDWHQWPEEYQQPSAKAVEAFAEQHAEEIEFLMWLQWVADEQLAAAARAAKEAGMRIGLYRDLAVGCDRSGAETWANPHAFMAGAQVGAPPDIFNPAGQDWGLPPFHPKALHDEEYRSFVELIRANMRHAGGLRIDHVMGLQHLYCIPEGCSPGEGAYVGYPIDDLIGILALESQRHECLVVGEDLGTVPDGFREKMSAANVLSYRVLFFEQDWDDGGFLPPTSYPRLALAVAGSHDLPTLVGWWKGHDIDLKERLGLYPSEDEARSQRQRRTQERAYILEAFRKEGVLQEDGDITDEQFAIAAHEFLALTTSALVVPQLDDLLGEAEQVNVPATFLENPNWRRKYRLSLEEIALGECAWRRIGRLPEIRRVHRRVHHAT